MINLKFTDQVWVNFQNLGSCKVKILGAIKLLKF